MNTNSKLMEMLVGYASAHQHPFNIAVHLVGIPTIMLGVSIALSWVRADIAGVPVNLAWLVLVAMFVFYMTLDRLFAFAFLAYGIPVVWLATVIGLQPMATSGAVAAATFGGGYLAQFVGHAVEKSAPVIFKHPVQANLAAPFFTVVEVFKLVGLRDDLFDEVQREIASRRSEQAA